MLLVGNGKVVASSVVIDDASSVAPVRLLLPPSSEPLPMKDVLMGFEELDAMDFVD